MECIAVEYFPISIYPDNNKGKYEFHSNISDENEQDGCDSHAYLFRLFKTFFKSVILVYGMSTVWENTDGCAKQYRFALGIYLINVWSSSYGVIIDRAINAPVHGNNVVGGINAMDKSYLKGEMEIIGKLGIIYTTRIGMLPSA